MIYINDLAEDLRSSLKPFPDDNSIFSIVNYPTKSSNELNSDFKRINNLAFHWKMSFNLDPLKQATEVHFSKKSNVIDHPDLVLNNNILLKASPKKHLGLMLDHKHNFKKHIDKKLCKVKKGIRILRKLYHFIPKLALLRIYKTFIRTHLDYGDIICN